MKITAIETLRTQEFSNVLWVCVHTDAGIVGLERPFTAPAPWKGTSTTRWPFACWAATRCTWKR